jgi:putative membrane protein
MENPTNTPTEHYERMGWKTFYVFMSERMKIALIAGLVTFAFVFLNIPYTAYVVWIFLIIFTVTLLISWVEYASFGFLLGADALKVKKGILHKEEVAIPYRQIQNVDIERNFLDLIAGTSRLIILTAGHDDNDAEKEGGKAESEGIIPVMDKRLAARLQTELLSKASVQKVIPA